MVFDNLFFDCYKMFSFFYYVHRAGRMIYHLHCSLDNFASPVHRKIQSFFNFMCFFCFSDRPATYKATQMES